MKRISPLPGLRTRVFAVVAATLVGACADAASPTRESPLPDKARIEASAAPSVSAPAVASTPAAAPSMAPVASATTIASAEPAPTATPTATAPAEAAPIIADNQVKPDEGTPKELEDRARGLFEAIVKDEPELGDPFWFPREPFIPLKDVKGPEKYWKNLHQAYINDIRKAHKKWKSWEGAAFTRFDRGSTPKWVKPGDEANKIGYYRSFHGKIRYTLGGENYSIDVHTVITWQGKWYVTHLGKFKK